MAEGDGAVDATVKGTAPREPRFLIVSTNESEARRLRRWLVAWLPVEVLVLSSTTAARRHLASRRPCAGVMASLDLPGGSGTGVLAHAFEQWPVAARFLLVPAGELTSHVEVAAEVGAFIVVEGTELSVHRRVLERAARYAVARARRSRDSGVRPRLSAEQVSSYFPQTDVLASVLAELARAANLSERQSQTLALHMQGMPLDEIAAELEVRPGTARVFMQQVRHKTGSGSTLELVHKLYGQALDESARASQVQCQRLQRALRPGSDRPASDRPASDRPDSVG